MMLSAGVHTGTRNSDSAMEEYIWRRRKDGLHILNIGKTWEKIMLAARVIVAIENPEDVVAISARPWGMRAVLKFAHYTGAQSIAGRFTPGTFTNAVYSVLPFPKISSHVFAGFDGAPPKVLPVLFLIMSQSKPFIHPAPSS